MSQNVSTQINTSYIMLHKFIFNYRIRVMSWNLMKWIERTMQASHLCSDAFHIQIEQLCSKWIRNHFQNKNCIHTKYTYRHLNNSIQMFYKRNNNIPFRWCFSCFRFWSYFLFCNFLKSRLFVLLFHFVCAFRWFGFEFMFWTMFCHLLFLDIWTRPRNRHCSIYSCHRRGTLHIYMF